MSKLKTIAWFLKNPKYTPHILQVIKRNKNKVFEDTSKEATQWCKENCISQITAIEKLTGNKSLEELSLLFPTEISTANKIMQECPVQMGGEGAISFLYHIVKATKSLKIIETGVAYGWSSLAMLLAINEIDNAKLISNDMPYIKMNNDDYVGCIIPSVLKSKWELQRQPDVKGIPMALKKMNNEIDLCHYDSDKSYTGRMWASPLLWNALKANGLFISDDINDNLAFRDFCKSVNRTPMIIEHLGKYVGVLVK